ncbi:MAG TPA: tetratricopeptide repeat protein, partial [Planctomycetaceae bacterium]|nr:tetratricopeptide repeat protein [Planctomycetaceae bacterium]
MEDGRREQIAANVLRDDQRTPDNRLPCFGRWRCEPGGDRGMGRTDMRLLRLFRGLSLLVWVLLGTASELWADLAVPASKGKASQEATSTPQLTTSSGAEPRGLQLQVGEEPLLPLSPKKAKTTADQQKQDALAWYLTGRLRHERGQFQQAMEAYQRAAELDPTRPEIYRGLVATAIELKQNDKAIQYALKAIELNPNDFLLLRMVGTYLAARPGRLTQAIDLLQRAARSPSINKRSGFYVTLMRDLATFYLLLRQPDKAADCLEIVFDARIHPEKYELDARTRDQLAKDRTSSFQRIGQTFVAAKRYQEAIDAFNRAIKERRGRPGTINFDLAYAYFQVGHL